MTIRKEQLGDLTTLIPDNDGYAQILGGLQVTGDGYFEQNVDIQGSLFINGDVVIPGGVIRTLAETLTAGNATSGNDIVISNGDAIVSGGDGYITLNDGLEVSGASSFDQNVNIKNSLFIDADLVANTVNAETLLTIGSGTLPAFGDLRASDSFQFYVNTATNDRRILQVTGDEIHIGEIQSVIRNFVSTTWDVTISGTQELVITAGLLNAQNNELRTSGFLSLGADPAASGLIRIANNNFINSRNAADNDDINLIGSDGSNNIIIGDSSVTSEVQYNATVEHQFSVNGSTDLIIGSGVINIQTSSITSSDGYVTVADNLEVTGDGYFEQDVEISGDLGVRGKLTVDGLVDPTGIVLDVQSSVPGGTPTTGKATFWIRDTDGYGIITDENGNNIILDGLGGGGEGGGETLSETLAIGNTTSGNDIVISDGDALVSGGDGYVTINDGLQVTGDGTFDQYLSVGDSIFIDNAIFAETLSMTGATSHINIGSGTLPTIGTIRGTNAFQIYVNTALNDRRILEVSGDQILIGELVTTIRNFASTTWDININGEQQLVITDGLLNAQDTEIRTSGFVSIGTAPYATDGEIRGGTLFNIFGRTTGGTNTQLLDWNGSSGLLTFGDGTNPTSIISDAATSIQLRLGGTEELSVVAGIVDARDNEIRTTGFLAVGATPYATDGEIRGGTLFDIFGRTSGGTDVQLFDWDGSSGLITLGDGTNPTSIILDAATSVQLRLGGTEELSVVAGIVDARNNEIRTSGFLSLSNGELTLPSSGDIRVANGFEMWAHTNASDQKILEVVNNAITIGDDVLGITNSMRSSGTYIIDFDGYQGMFFNSSVFQVSFGGTQNFSLSETLANFFDNEIRTTGFGAFGPTPASTGGLRLSNGSENGLRFRNVGDTEDIVGIGVDTSNQLSVGDGVNTNGLVLNSAGVIHGFCAGVEHLRLSTGVINAFAHEITSTGPVNVGSVEAFVNTGNITAVLGIAGDEIRYTLGPETSNRTGVADSNTNTTDIPIPTEKIVRLHAIARVDDGYDHWEIERFVQAVNRAGTVIIERDEVLTEHGDLTGFTYEATVDGTDVRFTFSNNSGEVALFEEFIHDNERLIWN